MEFRVKNAKQLWGNEHPYDYKLETLDYQISEWEEMVDWLSVNHIPHSRIGFKSIWLREKHVGMFLLRWT